MFKIIKCILMFLILLIGVFITNSYTDNLYLGKIPPGIVPKLFLPEIFVENDFSEYVYNILPGKEACVFDRHAEYGYPQGDIFVSYLLNGGWSEPKLYEVFKNYKNLFLPTISPDGNRWFFTCSTLGKQLGIKGSIPLFYIDKSSQGRGEPVYIGQHIHASSTNDGTLFVMVEGRDTSYPSYRRYINGRYTEYIKLEPSKYFNENDAHLVVDPSGNYIIFDSETRPSIGRCKLFISFKEPDGSWIRPISMGKYIKQKASLAWITYDGKYILFKDGKDVYWVSAKIVELIRSQNIK